jgi:hypothetical protein
MKLERQPNLETRKTQERQGKLPPPVMTPLTKLEMAVDALSLFQRQNERILSRLNELTEAVAVAEDAVKTFVKQQQRTVESDEYIAEYSQPKSRWYDPTRFRTALSQAWDDSAKALDFIRATGLIKIKEEVDDKLLKTLVAAEKIPSDVAKAAYVEENYGGPRVTIKRKEKG